MTPHSAETPSHNIPFSLAERINAHPGLTFDLIADRSRLTKPPSSERCAARPINPRSHASAECCGGPETLGHAAVVLSMVGNRTDFDWCGSLAQAIRTRASRIASGQYERVCLRRIRRAGSRRKGTRCWLYVSRPVMEWSRSKG